MPNGKSKVSGSVPKNSCFQKARHNSWEIFGYCCFVSALTLPRGGCNFCSLTAFEPGCAIFELFFGWHFTEVGVCVLTHSYICVLYLYIYTHALWGGRRVTQQVYLQNADSGNWKLPPSCWFTRPCLAFRQDESGDAWDICLGWGSSLKSSGC